MLLKDIFHHLNIIYHCANLKKLFLCKESKIGIFKLMLLKQLSGICETQESIVDVVDIKH